MQDVSWEWQVMKTRKSSPESGHRRHHSNPFLLVQREAKHCKTLKPTEMCIFHFWWFRRVMARDRSVWKCKSLYKCVERYWKEVMHPMRCKWKMHTARRISGALQSSPVNSYRLLPTLDALTVEAGLSRCSVCVSQCVSSDLGGDVAGFPQVLWSVLLSGRVRKCQTYLIFLPYFWPG